MRATLWFWITIALTVLWMTEPAIAGHSTKKKGAKRRASARLQRNTQGKQLALELLSSQASPTLQTLAGLHEGQILDGDDADEVAREDDVPVDITTIRTLWMAYVDGEQPPSGLSQRQVMEFIMDWLGRPIASAVVAPMVSIAQHSFKHSSARAQLRSFPEQRRNNMPTDNKCSTSKTFSSATLCSSTPAAMRGYRTWGFTWVIDSLRTPAHGMG